MENPPLGLSSGFQNSRIPTDGRRLDEDDTDMWADVAEASHRLDRFNNDNVNHKKPQKVKSQSMKRQDDPRRQYSGESRKGSLSPCRHSGSISSDRSKNEQHRKGVVPHRTGRSSESLASSKQSLSSSLASFTQSLSSLSRLTTQNRPPTTIGVSHPGETQKASTNRVRRRRMSTGDGDCYKRDHAPRERYSKPDSKWTGQVSTSFDNHKQQSQPLRREVPVQSCAPPDKPRREKPIFDPLGGSRRRNSMIDISTREDRAHEACQDQVKEKIKSVLDDRKSSGKERNGAVVRPAKKRVDTIELPARRSPKLAYDRLLSRWGTSTSDTTVTRTDHTHKSTTSGGRLGEDPIREQIKPVLRHGKNNNKEKNGVVKGSDETRLDTIELPARPCPTARRKRNSLPSNYDSTRIVDEELRKKSSLLSILDEVGREVHNDVAEAIRQLEVERRTRLRATKVS